MDSLYASVAVAVDEGDYLQVAFAEPLDGTERYVVLQLAKRFYRQDVELGMTAIYLEIDDQSHSAYGAIEEIAIRGNRVSISLNEAMLALPAGTSPIEVICSVSRDDFSSVRDMILVMGASAAVPVTVIDE